MSKVYIRTYAYNAEKTIRRAVESILSQTHEDWVYYLCDNGATDRTGQIIDEYARKDHRIKAFHNKVNRAYLETPEALFLPHHIEDDDFFCTLDADDEYTSTFLTDMLAFVESGHLDIAICGSDFLNAENNGALAGRRLTQSDLIIAGEGWGNLFPHYHQFIRTVWGKLFKGKTLRHTVQDSANAPEFPKAYGGDTYNAVLSLLDSERVGILSKSLHRYYVSHKSVSYQWIDGRNDTDNTLLEQARDFLIQKCGAVTPVNEEFLLIVYMNALTDTLKVLIGCNEPEAAKIDIMCEMFLCGNARSLASREGFGALVGDAEGCAKRRGELFAMGAQWLLLREEVADGQVGKYCELGEFLCAACENADGWVSFKKLFARFLMETGRVDEAKVRIDELTELLPGDEDVGEICAMRERMDSGMSLE
ncbi:MAG: glycosyltransferase [Peptococcaceae bacterium]|jgi:glycosyltransferase involved in cell wall biosynthesis|nr:glycosyltransferase [Peptococcaceae bacterium]